MTAVIKKFITGYSHLFYQQIISKAKGRHKAIFSNKEEEITVQHNVKNRNVFANGTLLAAKWLINNKKAKAFIVCLIYLRSQQNQNKDKLSIQDL